VAHIGYVINMDSSAARRHVDEVVFDMGKLFRGSYNNLAMTLNLIAVIFLSIAAMVQYFRHNTADLILVTDAAFSDSQMFATNIPPSTTYVIDNSTLALDNSKCSADDRVCRISHVASLVVGHSGLLSNHLFGFADKSIHINHIVWVVSWFTTPISLFLFANASWADFEQWMWWVTYVFIFGWNAVGLVFMIFDGSSTLYNSLFAVLYCIFSTALMFSVREAWRVVTNDGSEKVKIFASAASSLKLKSPKLMQVPLNNMKPSYLLAASSEEQVVPIEIRYISSQTALVVTELFFLIPVLNMIATAMVQHRLTAFDLQTRYWVCTIFFGSLILMEKTRRVGVTYMTDVCLIMLAIFTCITQLWVLIPDLMFIGATNVPAIALTVYIFIILAHGIGICLIIANAVLASIMQKTLATMTETQQGLNEDVKMLERFESITFKTILVLLIALKITLAVRILSKDMIVA
jgi:hypothetical protein